MKVIFNIQRLTKNVSLPSLEGSEVIMYTKLTMGEQRNIFARFPNMGNASHPDAMNGAMEMLRIAIVDWNLYDSEDNKVEICEDTFNAMSSTDVTYLINQLNPSKEETEEDKKKS